MEDEETGGARVMPAMRSFALTATAEFLLFIGVVFVLLGIANFLTDYLGIKGSGEAIVGLAMVLIAFVLLLRLRPRVRVVQQPPPESKAMADSGDYR